MSGKDTLKLILITYGFNKDIEISNYRGDDNYIGYEVNASCGNINYREMNCEGLQYHIFQIISFMNKHNIKPKTIVNAFYSTSDLLKMSNEKLSKLDINP